MSKVLIVIVAINVLIVGTIAGTLFLAETYPFHPGDGLYPLQNSAEQLRLRVTMGGDRQASWSFELAERRLADLAHCEPDNMVYCLMAFDSALKAAGEHILALSEGDELHTSLYQLLQQADIIIAGIENQSSDKVAQALVINLKDLVASLRIQPSQQSIARVSQSPDNTLTEAVPIPFIGEEDFDHGFYPLVGKHAETQCESCHDKGMYASTPTDCLSCHELPQSVLYPNHFKGECADCHDRNDWKPVAFDHIGILECKSCHVDETPTGHSAYIFHDEVLAASLQPVSTSELIKKLDDDDHDGERPCMDCHVDHEDWTEVIFTHDDGFLDCAMCHTSDAPERHYDGQCSRCHNTTAWDQYTFDHTGYSDCLSCHLPGHEYYPVPCTDCHQDTDNWWKLIYAHEGATDCAHCHTEDAPVGHYPGQCSNCHGTDTWGDDINFSHDGLVDCRSCHEGPDNHYGGQCSNCHSTSVWMPAWFNHNGFSNCSSCHTKASHYDGVQCSVCHTVNNWSFDHNRVADCAMCHTAPAGHYGGQCSNCHNRSNWNEYTFNHTGLNDCASCHTAPIAHVYGGQCSLCHNTSNWSQISFNHSGMTDCASCHSAPPEHWGGQCSNCHNTSNWAEASFNHDGATDCASCHPAPSGHWPGQCSDCHNTSSWSDYTFNHTGYTDCKACHSVDRPSGHTNGQCSKCHTTDTWYVPPTPVPPTNTPAPTPTDTPVPTNTPIPTDTPVPTPTNTPVPTDTPTPTPTNTPNPTPIPVEP